MKRITGLIALAACLAVAADGRAQGLERGADPEGVLVQELVVRGRAPGPAWWRVSDGDSTVWVLGVPAYLPKAVGWNDAVLRDRLSHAHAVILPPQMRIGLLKWIGFFLKHRKALKAASPMEQGLPPDLAARFAAARGGLGKPAKRYAGWRPAVAGVILDADFRKAAGVDQGQPLGRIRADAGRAHAPASPAAKYDSGALFSAILGLSPQADRECLSDSLAEVEAGRARVRAAAAGWASGDVAEAVTAERGYDRCLAALPGVSDLLERGQADMARAIAEALKTPGDTIAVVDLRSLLAKGGVLERLRAEGYAVHTPDEA